MKNTIVSVNPYMLYGYDYVTGMIYPIALFHCESRVNSLCSKLNKMLDTSAALRKDPEIKWVLDQFGFDEFDDLLFYVEDIPYAPNSFLTS